MVRACLLALLAAPANPALAWSLTLDAGGQDLRWPADGPDGGPWLPLAGNPTNASGLSEDDVRDAIVTALQRWSAAAGGVLEFDYWQGTDPRIFVPEQAYDGLSSVFFASASPSGRRPAPMVAGHTQIWFDPDSGRILEADILLNDVDWTFTRDPLRAGYAGAHRGTLVLDDVLTHELGHAWGLGHSGLVTATMFAAAWAGQSTPSCDDTAAIRTLYRVEGDTGVLTGTVLAEGTEVLGAQVTALSRDRGLPLTAALTDADGRFVLSGLPAGTYHLLVEPFGAGSDSLSSFYAAGPEACRDGLPARAFVAEEGVLRDHTVTAGEHLEVGPLSLACTADGSAQVTAPPGFEPELARGTARAGLVHRLPAAGDPSWWLRDVSGRVTLTALSWSLFSPVRVGLRVYDAAGRELLPDVALLPRWHDDDTGQAVWDARVVLTLPSRGDYRVELRSRPVSRDAWPMGDRHVDDTPYVVLLAEPSARDDPDDPTSCTTWPPPTPHPSPPGPPFRRALEDDVATETLHAGCGDSGCGHGKVPLAALVLPLPALLRRRTARSRRAG